MHCVSVLLPTALDRGFDYLAPEGMALAPGDVVQVDLAGRTMVGVVWGDGDSGLPEAKLKPVRAKLDAIPPFDAAYRAWLSWVASYCLAPIGAVLKMALSTGDALTRPPRRLYNPEDIHMALPPLSVAQKAVVDNIISLPEHVHQTFVVHGVTGSGKTELYYGAMGQVLARNPGVQVLVLLPEIALTHQWLFRFRKVFGCDPVVWHSSIGPAERKRAYLAIANGDARVVVGARSALFLPYRDLGMIVVDEEHEPSYKQDDGVLYHGRDMAVARGAFGKIPVLLVSATPSLETLANVEAGKYRLFHLPERFGGATMPEVSLIDMRAEKLDRGNFISPSLRAAMLGALARGEQALLFLNRRGYAPLLLCRHCGHRFQCADCSAWLVLHKKGSGGQLHCHHCGHKEPAPTACPACGTQGQLAACGPGVERVAEEVRELLPDARLSVLSSDAAIGPEEIEAIVAGERDIIVGTQMVAKGHHFPKLSTVGVIDADLGLQGGDLRASERSYQLLHQLSGRAGREAIRGHVYLQTYLPGHPVMQALLGGDADAFLRLEREGRKHALWPPYGQLASLLFDGPNEIEVRRVAEAVVRAAPEDPRVRALGPAPAALSRLKGQYRYRVLVKTTREVHLQKLLADWVGAVTLPRSVRLKVDMNPYSFV